MRTTVREACSGDLQAINDLTDLMHQHLASLYGLQFSAEELKEEHYDEHELGNVYVAADEHGAVVGYISFSLRVDEWAGPHYDLEHIVVHEDYWGLSIAGKLFGILLERAGRENVNITTGTLSRNSRALRFYKELGFKPLSVRLLLDLQNRILGAQ